MMLAEAETEHEIIPLPGSARQLDGSPADLCAPLDYPVEAVCLECGRPVRCERWLSLAPGDAGTWRHILRFSVPAAGAR